MKNLSKLPEDIRNIVIRMPFRVGLFVSESDQTGGDESAEAERKALENIVTFYVEDTVKGEFAHEVMEETLNHKSDWANWSVDLDKVPEECLHIGYQLKDYIDEKEISAFKQNLIEVGIVIAQAYCEVDETSTAGAKLEAYTSLFLRRFQSMFAEEPAPTHDYVLNVSKSERGALKLLSNNLNVKVSF